MRRSAAIRRWSAGCSCDTDRSDTRVGLWQHGGAATGSIASESIRDASDDGFAAFAANAGDAGTPPTVPAGNSATPPANPTGSAAAQPSAKRPRMKLIAAIIAVLVVLAGTGFGLAARKLEWIGPRTVPTVRYRTAAEVSRELEAKGFLVKKKQKFNALGKASASVW